MSMNPNPSAVAVTCNASSSLNLALPTGGGNILRCISVGPQVAFLAFSNDANSVCSPPLATGGGGAPVASNVAHQDFFVPAGATRMAWISAGNSVVYVARGDQHS